MAHFVAVKRTSLPVLAAGSVVVAFVLAMIHITQHVFETACSDFLILASLVLYSDPVLRSGLIQVVPGWSHHRRYSIAVL